MSEIRQDTEGPHHVHHPVQVTGVQGPQVITQAGISDVLESSTGTKGKKTVDAMSPELMQAIALMWFTSGSNDTMFFFQHLKDAPVAAVGATGQSQPINAELFKLQVENKLNEICIGVLNAWSKSIHDDAVAARIKDKKDRERHYEELHGHAGFNAWRNELSPEQRRQVDESSMMEKFQKIDQGVQHGLRDYLTMIKTSTDPTISQDLPFVTAALIVSGSARPAYVGIVDTVTTSQILITPVMDANTRAIQQIAPLDQALALSYLGSFILAAASYHALAQTLTVGSSEKPILDRKFAESYASKILEVVDGKGLNAIAMALISNSADPSEHMSEERKALLYKDVQIALLSTALALLYKTESSVTEDGVTYGGGIKSQEFIAMVNGNDKPLNTDLKMKIATKLRVLLEDNPDKDKLLASIGSFIDAHETSESLINVHGLFANITLDKGPNPMVVGG